MAMAEQDIPQIKEVTKAEDEIIKKYYKDYTRPFVRVGPAGYLKPARYGDHAADIYNLAVRQDDVWVISFSRSGTTWLQELVWLVANNMDFDAAKRTSLTQRFAFLEYPIYASDIPKPKSNGSATAEDFRTLSNLPSPRFVKTHLPLSLLPPSLLEKAKVLYIAREPRDVSVSFFFMHKLFRYFDHDVPFEEFWDLFKKDLLFHMPLIPHVKEAWQKRQQTNLMFLFYEDMQYDMSAVIDKVCTFLGKQYTAEQKRALANHLTFENMKKTMDFKVGTNDTELTFFRKGQSGKWVNYFDENMKEEAEEYIEKELAGADLRYPSVK